MQYVVFCHWLGLGLDVYNVKSGVFVVWNLFNAGTSVQASGSCTGQASENRNYKQI